MNTHISKHQTNSGTFLNALWAIAVGLVLALATTSAMASSQDYHDWSATCSGSTCVYLSTSTAGTITGTGSIWDDPGMWGVPYAITPGNLFTDEFSAAGSDSVTFTFSNGYNWGSGGQMLIGNIHNCFQYTLSAWDFNNKPIDVFDNWKFLAEYQSNAPGTLGYFSTSPTIRSRNADGLSEDFSVHDIKADPNSGQGGVVQLEGLQNVATIQLALSNNNLCTNGQGSDLILFNVASPLTGPLSAVMNTLATPEEEVDEFYLGFNGHLYELWWDGIWHYLDLTAAAGAPTASPSTAIASQIDRGVTPARLEAFYVDNAQHVHELYQYAATNTWQQADVTALSGAPLAAPGTPLVSVVNPYSKSTQAAYLDSSGHINTLYSLNGSSWFTADLTASSGAPAAAANSSLAMEVDPLTKGVEIYFLGIDRHVRALSWAASATGWHSSDPTAVAGAPNAATGSALASLYDPNSNTVQVDYLSTDQHIHQLSWNGAGWSANDLTVAAIGAPIAATGSSLASEVNIYNNTVELYYIANDQTVQELSWNGVWNSEDPSGSAGAPNATVGSPLASVVNLVAGTVMVHYISTDDHVHELLTYDWTNWSTKDVNLESGAPNAVP